MAGELATKHKIQLRLCTHSDNEKQDAFAPVIAVDFKYLLLMLQTIRITNHHHQQIQLFDTFPVRN